MDQELIKRIVEATLLAASQPLGVVQLAAVFDEEQPPPPGSIPQALADLAAESTSRGVELVEVASGFRYQVRTELYPWVSRLWNEKPPRYSRALLETLALIAYRQPITRGEIEQIRGVAVNSQIVRTLEEREWIRVVGHRDVPGKPALFGTTRGFLDYFNLKSLDQLPSLAELQDIAEFDPELDFSGTRPVAMPSVDDATGQPASDTSKPPATEADEDPDEQAQTPAQAEDESAHAAPAGLVGSTTADEEPQIDTVDLPWSAPGHDVHELTEADGSAIASTDDESTPKDADREDRASERNV
jgi:segregation and condensation protein B